MNIGIDIDDTLSYLSEIRIKTAKEYFKEKNLNYHLVRTDTHLFSEMFDWDQDTCDKFWFEKADNMLSIAPLRKNADKVIKQLKEAGHKIFIITARTKQWHKDPYELSYTWLKKNNIIFDELIVGQLNKTQVCLENNIDLFIDDMPGTLKELKAHSIDTLMMKTDHNIFCNDIKENNTWEEVLLYAKQIDKKHQKENLEK